MHSISSLYLVDIFVTTSKQHNFIGNSIQFTSTLFNESQRLCRNLSSSGLFLFIKNDMKSGIQRETTAIFFLSNLYLKEGIGYVYNIMVDFIYMGLLELQGTQSKLNTKGKILVHNGIRTRYLPLTKQTRYPLRHEIRYPQSVRS